MGDGDPADWLTLDVPQKQILLSYPGNPHGTALEWTGLCFRLGASRWVVVRCDGDVEEQGIARRRVIKLGRAAHYPAERVAADDSTHYYGDEQSFAGELATAAEMAELHGVDVTKDMEEVQRQVWVISDARSPDIGEEIAPALVAQMVRLDNLGIVRYKGKATYIMQVSEDQVVDEIAVFGGAAELDSRLIAKVDTTRKMPLLRFDAAFAQFKNIDPQVPPKHWGMDVDKDGPGITYEYCEGVQGNGADLEVYDQSWYNDLNLGEHSRDRHGHTALIQIAKVAAVRDRLGLPGLLCFEKPFRRIRFIERRQVRESASSSTAMFYHSTSRDESGGNSLSSV